MDALHAIGIVGMNVFAPTRSWTGMLVRVMPVIAALPVTRGM